MQSPYGHDDSMLDPDQRIWGFETNFGGLAEIALVRANQLMPKPPHLTWEEAASMPLVSSTAYRMLVSPNGFQVKQGDIVLVWGAVGGLGGFALQYCLNAGAFPIAVVSSEEREKVARTVGARWVVNRAKDDFRFWNDDGDPGESRRGAPRTPRSCGASARSSASSPAARTRTSSSSTRGGRRSGRACTWCGRAARS